MKRKEREIVFTILCVILIFHLQINSSSIISFDILNYFSVSLLYFETISSKEQKKSSSVEYFLFNLFDQRLTILI
jgi:hypothetical protein